MSLRLWSLRLLQTHTDSSTCRVTLHKHITDYKCHRLVNMAISTLLNTVHMNMWTRLYSSIITVDSKHLSKRHSASLAPCHALLQTLSVSQAIVCNVPIVRVHSNIEHWVTSSPPRARHETRGLHPAIHPSLSNQALFADLKSLPNVRNGQVWSSSCRPYLPSVFSLL